MALEPQAFIELMVKRVDFSKENKALLKLHGDWGKEIAPDMAERFYSYLGSDPEMNAIVNATEGRIQRLHQTFIQWFHEMFTGIDDWGNAYAECRWRIGLVHVRIGIGPQHVVPAMAHVMQEVSNRIKIDGKPEELQEALIRICTIDLAFIEQAYVEVTEAAVLKETGWTQGLFKRLITTGAGGR
ncbi:MAG TPA: hypothetical protein DEG17_23870 [Cyanobacteria bacterium UBA11149]|nr:hypothetical protein [Cyanobacteria bacterium UBA11367]HBE60012.1 hypothetical protein [Cyanobacteria bacterium UBA11366]HBK66298.1 hypothetical protein [Cyanobacteria bacterium UBA11166]HBS72575.1 hypothetical protein [Cyanobacteria bacterium UBA11153]HBW91820.1 hypothetical protein [Cyanobacteria bacterium UBA11149]